MACINKSLSPSFHCNDEASLMPFDKYEPWCEYSHGIPFDTKWPQRRWPMQRLLRAPRWCSVDLRDGNQALINPMDVDKKIRLFRTLISMGFKEIEIGFPSASKLDFDFTRLLIQKEKFPDNVWLMVLVQAREHLIRQTVEALKGAKKVIIHLYNSTSELQRRIVFNLPKHEIKNMAVQATKLIRSLTDQVLRPIGCDVRFEYSPESFTTTEIQFSLEVCHAVMDAWNPSEENPITLNLPETVQNAGPHFYADQVEWMHTHLKDRKKVRISVHPHNDRGTGVASAELALQAGADRVEGCLFGNGERTGNVCLVTLAVNFLQHGIDPELDLSNIPFLVEVFEECTEMKVPERHPWAGSLVYTAFSGSHQDAIKKGLEAMEKKKKAILVTTNTNSNSPSIITDRQQSKKRLPPPSISKWEVPYLPIDPKDLGRTYEAIIRINSQSGKGGISLVMESEFGISLPRGMQVEFSKCVQAWCDQTATEIHAKQVYELFRQHFIDVTSPVVLVTYKVTCEAALPSPKRSDNEQQSSSSTTTTTTTQISPVIPPVAANNLSCVSSSSSTHKRLREAPPITLTTANDGGDQLMNSLSPKRRDLRKLVTIDDVSVISTTAVEEKNNNNNNTGEESSDDNIVDASSLSSTIITPAASPSPQQQPELQENDRVAMRDANINISNSSGFSECPSSEWLVIDRPVLTDNNNNRNNNNNNNVVSSPRFSPSDLMYIQSASVDSSPEAILIEGRILYTSGCVERGAAATGGAAAEGGAATGGAARAVYDLVNFSGRGNGPIDAFVAALNQLAKTNDIFLGLSDFEVQSYNQMAISKGSCAEAICFVEIKATTTASENTTTASENTTTSCNISRPSTIANGDITTSDVTSVGNNSNNNNISEKMNKQKNRNKQQGSHESDENNHHRSVVKCWGVARHANTTTASLRAICTAINRLIHTTCTSNCQNI